MASTIPSQELSKPSVPELLFLLSESAKLVRYTEETPLRIKENFQDSVARIIGLHAKHVPGAVCLDNRPNDGPILLISSDNPAFFEHVNKTITLLQNLAHAATSTGSDPDATNLARNELISHILHHSLGPHATEYNQLRGMLQRDLDTDLSKGTTRNPKDSKTKWLRDEVEAWCEGLTCALKVLSNAPGSDIAPATNNINAEEVNGFWDWAERRYTWLMRMENVYDYVIKYSELPSAADLLRYVNHVVKAIVLPCMMLANPENKHSSFMWLQKLTTKKLDNPQSSSELVTLDIDAGRLERWFTTLICNPPLAGDPHVAREVARSLIGAAGSKSLLEKWTNYVENAVVHPEAAQLIDIISTSLLANPGGGGKPHGRARRSLVSRTDGSCLACAAAYEATREVYGLEPRALCLFPTEGDSTPGPEWGSHGHSESAPCRMPPLPAAVEDKFKGMLVEKIKAIVSAAILERRQSRLPARREKGDVS